MFLEREDFELVTDFMCRYPIEFELGGERDWNRFSTTKVSFQINSRFEEPENLNLHQAALAIVIFNDARKKGIYVKKGKRFIRRKTLARYYGEWEAMAEMFLDKNPEFEVRNWRSYLKKK